MLFFHLAVSFRYSFRRRCGRLLRFLALVQEQVLLLLLLLHWLPLPFQRQRRRQDAGPPLPHQIPINNEKRNTYLSFAFRFLCRIPSSRFSFGRLGRRSSRLLFAARFALGRFRHLSTTRVTTPFGLKFTRTDYIIRSGLKILQQTGYIIRAGPKN